jgi:RHS repeat-associated protein
MNQEMISRLAPPRFPRILIGVLLALLIAGYLTINVQAQGSTDGTTPLGLTPGSPGGSYALSDFDVVNLYNGSLNFRLPLYQIAGRGGASYAITLQVQKKWTVRREFEPGVGYFYYADGSWWSENGVGWILDAGRMDLRTGYREQPTGFPVEGLTRVTFTAPDGTEYEFRDQLTNGQPKAPVSGGFNRGTVFVTADGTTATFISDWNIHETAYGLEPPFPDGYVKLKDGTQFRVDDGAITWMRDRNGNKVSFGYDAFRRVTSVTDSLQRLVTISYPGTTTGFMQISFKGYGGASRTIKIGQTNLANALRSGYTMLTGAQLFPELTSTWGIDSLVLNYVELPDGRSFQLRYNPYAELARVVLPTGGAVEYDYLAGLTNGAASGVFSHSFPPTEKYIYRRISERRVYPDGGSGSGYESRMTYSRPETTTTNLGYVITEQRNASGTLLTKTQHYFHGSPRASFLQRPTHYPAWKDGREYKTEIFDTNGTTVLRRVEHSFAQRAAVTWWGGTSDAAPANDPRVVETTMTIEPAGANLVSKQTFGYDDAVPFNNRNNVKEYNFGAGSAGSLAREARTTFVTSSSYTDNAVHLRGLPSQFSIHDSGGAERARVVYEYDNYTPDSTHAALTNRSNISGFDSTFNTSYTTRGNVTKTTKYLLVSGSPTGSIATYAQFDIAGNVVKSIDGRGYATELFYSDCFGAPNGEAQTSTDPTELGSITKTFAYATQVKNALSQWAYAQFDYFLGRPVDAKDSNGILASGYYDDLLDRPTQVKRAVGSAAESHSAFNYDDTNRLITTTSDLNTNNDGLLISKLLYDQMGRTIEARQYEGGGNYIAVKTQYDVLGRAYKTSNPFRPWQSESELWTTSAFDALGRIVTVTTPDSAVVTSSYTGNSATITDQAGKSRKSVTDALGRLVTIYEAPGGVNYETSYAYDVLDNLTTVTQGVQTRTFVYDSFKRLTSASNPENGTVSYTYDNNGNMLTRVDARSVTTTTTYDSLNRPTSRSYNDTPQTPTVNYFYDAQSLPSGAPSFSRGYSTGQLVAVTYGGGSEGTYRGYDQMGRVVRQYQRTDSVNYLVEATYYANGSVDDLTYPALPGAGDRRVVSYTNDSAGRLASLSSAATSYAPAASISSIAYTSHNGLKTETYGNGLIHSINYNNRLQPTEIKLGASGSPASVVGLTYGYGTTANNGNVLSLGYSGGGLSYTQSFGYDTLNRLTTSQETNGGTNWSQTNGYDRYGNRWIDLGGGNQSLYFTASSNRITGASYDNAGNLLNDGIHTYAYNGENKIRTIDSQSAYVYNGDGQRVRKLLGGNLRFVYGIGGELIAEFDGTSGALKKEYVYGASGLAATIEPTAVNSNGTRYATPDHLGSPRVITNSSASVVSRHDYMPFGEELGVGVGGRTAGMGFGVADGVRQKFTSYERDTESTFDYAGARYYSATQGRFASVDPLMASASTANPQTFNRYTYVSNSPLTQIDPTGMFGICPGGGQIGMGGVPLGTFSMSEESGEQQQQQPPPASGPPPPGGPVTPGPILIDIGDPPPGLNDIVVSVSPGREEFRANMETGDPGSNRFFTGYHSLLTISFTDANGNPLSGTGTESVAGQGCGRDPRIVQQPNAVTIQNGQITDLVGVGLFSPTRVTDQSVIQDVLRTNATTACTQTTTQTMTVIFPQGTFKVAFDRVFSNVDKTTGEIRRFRIGPNKEALGNYNISIGPVTVSRQK